MANKMAKKWRQNGKKMAIKWPKKGHKNCEKKTGKKIERKIATKKI